MQDEVIRGGAQAQSASTGPSPKFTPGPWFVDPDDRPGMEWNRHIVDSEDLGRIAFMSNPGDEGDEGQSEANAHLIAASPDLYEALKATHRLISEGAAEGFRPDVGDWAERLFANQGQIYAALRKAEGGE